MFFRTLMFIFFIFSLQQILVNGRVYRLPNNVHPVRYNLTLDVKLDSNPAYYNGSVSIQLLVFGKTKAITFHKKNFKLEEGSINVKDYNDSDIGILFTSESTFDETFTIHLDEELREGENYTLNIQDFSRDLKYEKKGFHLAKYMDSTGVERHLAVSDLEPTHARGAFPCFDEPGIKSRFIVNIIRDGKHHSLSNQELKTLIDLGNGRFMDTFKETPPMSSYILTFVISDYKSTKKLGRFRIFGKEEDIENGNFNYPLEVAVKTLNYLEEYTGIDYALSKLDLFAVPGQYFIDGAMENWGLIIYAEQYLLCSNTSAPSDLIHCTTYMAHEFAHQWFGNLVTPEWWNYIWLGESLASYFQYYIASKVQPEWRLMDLWITDAIQYAFIDDDYYGYSSPLSDKDGDVFPSLPVIYFKGSAIIRMMEHFLTEELLRKGLHNYLWYRQYQTAKPRDLYDALQKAVNDTRSGHLLDNHSVEDVLNAWETNGRFPVVTVTRDYATGSITFEQHQYTKHGRKSVKTPWYIPINYVFEADQEFNFVDTTAKFWLTEINKTVDGSFPNDGWLIVNKQQTGCYIVNYDNENWERIINFMNSDRFETIHVLNRARLLSDSFSLAASKLLPIDIAIRLSGYLVKEKDYIPFAVFETAIASVSSEIIYGYFKNGSSSGQEGHRKYRLNILNRIREHLGFEPKPTDTFLDRIYRSLIITNLCLHQDSQCIKYGEEKLKEVKEKGISTVPPELEFSLYYAAIGVNKASEEEWNALYHVYNTSRDIHQRDTLKTVLKGHKLGKQII